MVADQPLLVPRPPVIAPLLPKRLIEPTSSLLSPSPLAFKIPPVLLPTCAPPFACGPKALTLLKQALIHDLVVFEPFKVPLQHALTLCDIPDIRQH